MGFVGGQQPCLGSDFFSSTDTQLPWKQARGGGLVKRIYVDAVG